MIRCYRCGNELNRESHCPICNADVKDFKRVVAKSYLLYNQGLEAAKLRDISRAILLLKDSLKYFKGNIAARNLLGLCYYEVGDVMRSTKEWIISKNFQPDNNLALEYMEKCRDNLSTLKNINSMIKRYNLALRDCKDGKLDVAIIQLKKVISSNFVNILPAMQLLGLIYIQTNEYRKAHDILSRAEKIDRYNNITLRYLQEIEQNYDTVRRKKKSKNNTNDLPKITDNSGKTDVVADKKVVNDGYFSYVSYKDPSPIVAFGSLIFGLILGGLLVWLLILPTKEQSISKKYNEEINEMSEKIAGLQNTVNNLEDEADIYKQEADDIKTETKNKLNKIKMGKELLKAFAEMKNNNNQAALGILQKISAKDLSEDEKILYYDIASVLCEQDIVSAYNEGYRQYRSRNYNKAIEKFDEALKWKPDHDDALYYKAQAYISKDEKSSAQGVLEEYLQILPNGKHNREVSRDLIKIQSELNTEE